MDMMPCAVLNKRDFGGHRWKSVTQPDLELYKFETINPGVWADKISCEDTVLFVVGDEEVSTLFTPSVLLFELKTLPGNRAMMSHSRWSGG